MPPQPSRPIKYWIIIFLLLLYAIPVSFLAFKKSISTTPKLTDQPPIQSNELYDSQLATIQGKINKIDGSVLTVTNNHHKSGQIEVGKGFHYNNQFDPLATGSGDLKKIPLEKDVLITLELQSGSFKVVAIADQFPQPEAVNLPKNSQKGSSSNNAILPPTPDIPSVQTRVDPPKFIYPTN